jgi:hypothetical protein
MKISSFARFPQALEHFHFYQLLASVVKGGFLEESHPFTSPTPEVKMLSRKSAQNCRLAGVGAPANRSEN